MYQTPKLLTAATLLLLAPVLQAQTAFLAEAGGKLRLVQRVSGTTPQVDDGSGKLVPATNKYGLTKAANFLPITVAVKNVQATGRYVDLRGEDMEASRKFEFKATLESPAPLQDVYLVLDFNTDRSGHVLHVQEIGNLVPGQPVPVRVLAYVGEELDNDRYKLHLYSGGVELMNSLITPKEIEDNFDAFVKEKIANVTDAPPKPHTGPKPEYPASLKAANVSGKAVVRITIGADGRVSDAQLKSASDPLFGESALTTAKQWRFIPRVKAGKPVQVSVDLPFNFDAPKQDTIDLSKDE